MKLMSRIAKNGALVALLLQASVASAVTPGQIDTFEDGTQMGWRMGASGFGPVTNIATGGPAGADDNFIQIISDGVSATGRMTIFNNDARWLGDYAAATVTAVRMNLRNLGATDLSIRLALRDGTTAGAPTALSSTPVVLSVGGAWTTANFSLGVGNLIFEDGATAAVLSSPVDLRIFHAPSGAYPGPFIVASLGVDNIQAIPEPAMVALMLVGGALVLGWVGWQRKSTR